MPPILALLITLCGAAWLYVRDVRQLPRVSGALWLPVIWLLIIGSRSVTEWLSFGVPMSASAIEDGAPADRLVFSLLIAGGLCVLWSRRVRLLDVVRSNVWLSVFLLYCFLAILWSDYPIVAFKRWVKVLGHPIMALVVITDPYPKEALARLLKRGAYLLIPVSIVFIKYFPHLGRRFDPWTGEGMNTGITTNKNMLGWMCMVLGIFFTWHLVTLWRETSRTNQRGEILLTVGFLSMIAWLMLIANSKTALVCMTVGIATLLILGSRMVAKQYVGTYLIVAVLAYVVADSTVGVYEWVLAILGREATLTDRTLLWQEVLRVDINPLLGAGFESFWLGERLEHLWSIFRFRPNQAHNGYLETYLNLGLIGLALLIGIIVATYFRAKHALVADPLFGRLSLGLLAAIVLYNYTESTFKTTHLVWFAFYLVALRVPDLSKGTQRVPRRALAPLSPPPRPPLTPAGVRLCVSRGPAPASTQREPERTGLDTRRSIDTAARRAMPRPAGRFARRT